MKIIPGIHVRQLHEQECDCLRDEADFHDQECASRDVTGYGWAVLFPTGERAQGREDTRDQAWGQARAVYGQ